ncbi:DUF4235 domain-containing protein [Streptomyces sp. NPDC047108]|uniref:DUF4235 domain-containing protein n=1 Tax=Streptomyces sp. NPDC047108 TaxID=3155025 RepID=UPI00340DDFA3
MGRMLYKVLAMVSGIVGGMVAGAIFKRVWRLLPGQDRPPAPTDEDRTWREVLPAAALQGAITAGVRAGVKRGEASGMRRLTGTWPT